MTNTFRSVLVFGLQYLLRRWVWGYFFSKVVNVTATSFSRTNVDKSQASALIDRVDRKWLTDIPIVPWGLVVQIARSVSIWQGTLPCSWCDVDIQLWQNEFRYEVSGRNDYFMTQGHVVTSSIFDSIRLKVVLWRTYLGYLVPKFCASVFDDTRCWNMHPLTFNGWTYFHDLFGFIFSCLEPIISSIMAVHVLLPLFVLSCWGYPVFTVRYSRGESSLSMKLSNTKSRRGWRRFDRTVLGNADRSFRYVILSIETCIQSVFAFSSARGFTVLWSNPLFTHLASLFWPLVEICSDVWLLVISLSGLPTVCLPWICSLFTGLVPALFIFLFWHLLRVCLIVRQSSVSEFVFLRFRLWGRSVQNWCPSVCSKWSLELELGPSCSVREGFSCVETNLLPYSAGELR